MGSADWQATTQTSVAVKTRRRYDTPGKYRVIFWNDDVTTFDFVIQVLTEIFSYSVRNACLKALEIDRQGNGIIGTYILSIAEAKRDAALRCAREQGYPLKVTIEPIA